MVVVVAVDVDDVVDVEDTTVEEYIVDEEDADEDIVVLEVLVDDDDESVPDERIRTSAQFQNCSVPFPDSDRGSQDCSRYPEGHGHG